MYMVKVHAEIRVHQKDANEFHRQSDIGNP